MLRAVSDDPAGGFGGVGGDRICARGKADAPDSGNIPGRVHDLCGEGVCEHCKEQRPQHDPGGETE